MTKTIDDIPDQQLPHAILALRLARRAAAVNRTVYIFSASIEQFDAINRLVDLGLIEKHVPAGEDQVFPFRFTISLAGQAGREMTP